MSTGLNIELVESNAAVSLGNCRPTVSHKAQTDDNARAPYDRMVANGEDGLSLWDRTEPAQVITVAKWQEIMGTCTVPEGAQYAYLTGNCRGSKTLPDAIATLRAAKVDLDPDQLLIPILDISDSIVTKMDILAAQVGDNEKDKGRIKLTQRQKLDIVITAKKSGLVPTIEPQLKRKLRFNRADQQIFASLFKAFAKVKSLRKRVLSAPTDRDKIKELQYSPTGPFPINNWPRSKMISLFSAAQKTPALTATLADDIEALLKKALSKGGNADARLTYAGWTSAAEEAEEATGSADTGIALLAKCVDKASLAPALDVLGPVLYDAPSNARRLYDLGVETEAPSKQFTKAHELHADGKAQEAQEAFDTGCRLLDDLEERLVDILDIATTKRDNVRALLGKSAKTAKTAKDAKTAKTAKVK